jgi:CheY-like chemotaxis protein
MRGDSDGPASQSPPHVLVVDDDSGIRELIAEVLLDEQYSVATAANGLEALNRIADRRPALVLLDLQMPVMTGWDVLARMREQGLAIPVVFMTAGFRAQTEAERYRVDGHLSKPFEMEELLRVVARLTSPPGD